MLTLLVKFFSLSDQFLLNEFKQNFGRDRTTGNQIGKGNRKDSRPDLIQCPFHQTSLTAEIKTGIIALQGRDLFFEFCRNDSLIQQRFCLGCNAIRNVIYPYNGGSDWCVTVMFVLLPRKQTDTTHSTHSVSWECTGLLSLFYAHNQVSVEGRILIPSTCNRFARRTA